MAADETLSRRRRWRRTALVAAVAAVAYAASALVFTPRLRHGWRFLHMNPGRTYAQFVGLSAATCLYPWCYRDARRTFDAIRVREPIGVDEDGIDRYRATGRLRELLPALFPDRKCIAFDARMKSMADFAAVHRQMMADEGGYRLWCIGRYDYVFTAKFPANYAGTNATCGADAFFASFSEKFDDFAAAGIYSPADLFACYVGDDAEVGPAFSDVTAWDWIAGMLTPGRLAFRPPPTGGRAPADPSFVTPNAQPDVSWLGRGELSAKVYFDFLERVEVVQGVRRDVLLGYSVAAQGGATATNAIPIWAHAAEGNPRDPLLANLADTFDRQGRQFLKLGNANGALQCYENRLVVFPKDIAAMSNFAVCLKRAGHKEMADQVFARARKLYESMEKARP